MLAVPVVIASCSSAHRSQAVGPTVPAVVGLDAASACKKISTAGLRCGTAPGVVKCSSHPRNQVLQVSPRVGREVAPNGQVSLTVSSGACDARVPNVVGLNVDDASQRLGNLRFTVAYRCTVDPAHNGRVDKQEPSAGKPAGTASSVTITVALPHCAASTKP
jgi:eukaryotic-like serine/threonine-protein kinase